MSDGEDIAVDLDTLVGRTIQAVDIVQYEFERRLRLTLDDGQQVEVGGYTDTFNGLGVVTVGPPAPDGSVVPELTEPARWFLG